MYRALYRKWRPQTFSDVSGQPHVTQTLMHEVEAGKLSHAYLFTGSRGTGKTTCAKILAKAVNCLHPVGGNPCNECEICRGIDDGSVLDVIEIDAASNNGVDNIRDLREEANFTPVKAKFRVYIIDEVHMLSIGAFNALLKILEEPPSYVLFILATTEVHKLPATILSRCQRFDFHHIPPESIAERLHFVAKQENMNLTDEGAVMIARYADGALRDALSLLDRCSARGETITPQLVSDCAGIAGKTHLFSMADCIVRHDAAAALQLIGTLHASSVNMERLCVELTEHFRNLMVSKVVRDPSSLIICSKEDLTSYKTQSDAFTLETILDCISVLGETTANLKRGLDRKIETETALLRLCTPSLSADANAILRRIAELESKLSSGVRPVVPAENTSPAEPAVPKNEASLPVQTKPDDSSASLFKLWPEVIREIKQTVPAVSSFLNGSSATVRGSSLLIHSSNPVLFKFLKLPMYLSGVEAAVEKVSGQKLRLQFNHQEDDSGNTDPLQDLMRKIDEIQKESD